MGFLLQAIIWCFPIRFPFPDEHTISFFLGIGNSDFLESSLVNTLPITKKNKYTVVKEAHKGYAYAAYAPAYIYALSKQEAES